MKHLYLIQRELDCGISGGFGINCQDLRKPGGLFRAVWVYNNGDLRTPIDVTLAAFVTNLDFSVYQSLYKFESNKYSHEANWTQQSGDGGNISYLQTVILRVANNNPTADKVIEDATVSELGVITKSQAGEFLIWGAENGLSSGDATTGGTGRQPTDSAFTQLNLVGTERFLPKRLLIGGTAAATQLWLDAATA
jgi:hypothetical protein